MNGHSVMVRYNGPNCPVLGGNKSRNNKRDPQSLRCRENVKPFDAEERMAANKIEKKRKKSAESTETGRASKKQKHLETKKEQFADIHGVDDKTVSGEGQKQKEKSTVRKADKVKNKAPATKNKKKISKSAAGSKRRKRRTV